MNKFSFRNRIAFIYIISTALLIGAVFLIIFIIVKLNVLTHLNQDLQKEVERHLGEIEVKDGIIALKRHEEWMEREHNTVGVDPVFIEFLDANGKLIDKSPNLKEAQLLFSAKHEDNVFFDSELADKQIRQVQVPVYENNAKVGYLIVAVSLEGSIVVLHALSRSLLITYPFIILILFFIARFFAGRSIKPINSIIEISDKITKDNLSSRIPLPNNYDELFILSDTINRLLDRIEYAVEREKSFTSYASHEFRTPLAVLKGTLEVLIRRPREQVEYREKISFSIREIDRLNRLVDDLLLLTRFENQRRSIHLTEVELGGLLEACVARYEGIIRTKELNIEVKLPAKGILFMSDSELLSTIINNLLSNAIKYSYPKGSVYIQAIENNGKVKLVVEDKGIGIREDELEKVFDKFYRSYETDHPDIKGFGLGLPIVKRFCSLLNIKVSIVSLENAGTTVTLLIPSES